MKLRNRVSKAILVLRDKDIPQRLEIVSEKDIVIFVIGSTGSGKSTFINAALATKPMVVSEPSGLVSCTKSIQAFKCTSGPWDPYGRNIIFVDMPAFNHSKLDIQRRVPSLITTWLENHCKNKSVDSGILYLHAMLPRLNEGFDKHFDPFVKLCHEKNHRPISALLVTSMWPNRVTQESEAGLRKEVEEHFKKTGADIRKIPASMRFDIGHKSACEAIEVLLKDIMVSKGVKEEPM